MPEATQPPSTESDASERFSLGNGVTARIIKRDAFDANNPEDRVIKEYVDFASKQIADPFENEYSLGGTAGGDFVIVQPAYSPLELMKLPLQNNILLQCISAMVTNVESFGYSLVFLGKEEEKNSEQAKAERLFCENLLDRANEEESMTEVRKKVRLDLEVVGYSFMEVCRNSTTKNVNLVTHVPAFSMRMTKLDTEFTTVSAYLPRDGQLEKVTFRKRFRRFVQMVGTRRVYFKELGDPRKIDPKTGRVDENLKPHEEATEVIMFSLYWGGDLYGLPRYINQLPALLGSRQSELTNLQFFSDNCIPAMVVMVSGGFLTEQSVLALKQAFAVKGRDSMNRVLILEAQSPENRQIVEGDNKAVPKMEMKPMTAERQNDALFQEYDKNNRDKVRCAFRLPPLILGDSADYTKATADASVDMAEKQVFAPERDVIDGILNTKILTRQGKPLKYWRMRANASRTISTEFALSTIDMLSKAGAMTPNSSIELFNQMFSTNRPPIEEDWADFPFELIKLMVQNGKLYLNDEGYLEVAKDAGVTPENNAKAGTAGGGAKTDVTGK